MIHRNQLAKGSALRRRGATLVETSVVIVIFMLFAMGILEYGRVIFAKQVADSAAREGARWCVVRTQESNLEGNTKAEVDKRLGGVKNMMKKIDIEVYRADENGKKTGTPEQAEFGQNIAVEITADYEPILPSLLLLGNTIKIKSRVLMISEAN